MSLAIGVENSGEYIELAEQDGEAATAARRTRQKLYAAIDRGWIMRGNALFPYEHLVAREMGHFARIERVDDDTIELAEHDGAYIWINERRVSVASVADLTTGDNLLDADGSDSGDPIADATLYYIYASNDVPAFSPEKLMASATAPTSVNGVQMLGSTGDAAHWKYVGRFRLSGGNVVDSESLRLVENHYHREDKNVRARPAYNDNNATTTLAFAGTSWAAINGGTGDFVAWIHDGKAVSFRAYAFANLASATWRIAVGIDAATSPEHGSGTAQSAGGTQSNASAEYCGAPASGYHTAHFCAVVSGGSANFQVDGGRQGASADVAITYMHGVVRV